MSTTFAKAGWMRRPGRRSTILTIRTPDNYFYIVVRTSQAEQSVLPGIVAAIHKIDPEHRHAQSAHHGSDHQ